MTMVGERERLRQEDDLVERVKCMAGASIS